MASAKLASHDHVDEGLHLAPPRGQLVATRLQRAYKRCLAVRNANIGTQHPSRMPAINSLVARDQFAHLVAREENWAKQEAGVIVVFCIVGLVAIGLLALFIHKKLAARKANKAPTY